MKFGALPDAVLYALINAVANFDMTLDEKLLAGQSLRREVIGDMPGLVRLQVEDACERVREACVF